MDKVLIEQMHRSGFKVEATIIESESSQLLLVLGEKPA
jgi:hypothetical protein